MNNAEMPATLGVPGEEAVPEPRPPASLALGMHHLWPHFHPGPWVRGNNERPKRQEEADDANSES